MQRNAKEGKGRQRKANACKGKQGEKMKQMNAEEDKRRKSKV